MKYLRHIITFSVIVAAITLSCKKYKDPPNANQYFPNAYCNDPNAVNYNWNFPGHPDNTVCFYPTDVFKGTYVFVDSYYSVGTSEALYLGTTTQTLTISALSQTKISVSGFCGSGSLRLTAGKSYLATIDSVILDTPNHSLFEGQLWCRTLDTVNGTIFNSSLDTLLHINFTVKSDTGFTTHSGKAKKL